MINLYGWSDRDGQAFAPCAAQGCVPARVVVQQRGLYTLVTDHGELRAQLAGRLVHEAREGGHPVVGDWVAVTARPAEGAATIHAILPRRTMFVRKAADTVQAVQVVAANVDVALLVASMNADFNLRRLERYLATAWQSGARPVVVLTKADLRDAPDDIVAAAESIAFGVPVLVVSAVTGAGVTELAALLKPGETCVLVGSSGAGKSTLVNAFAGTERMATGGIREDDARGRHTTTHRELVRLPGGALILDTPGMRELGLIDAEEGLGVAFDDIEALARDCRFRDCGHGNEPGCAVRTALETGQLDPDRWRGFQKLQRELAHLDRKEDRAARAAEKRRWIARNKAYRAGQKFKNNDP
ncbi:ribosome small subunit-dependent GTPase A [Bradyrhizobium sp. C9]|uniref:ribosome small subunit-dependent GTPase A n=1 Tax=Bradyrhizobium sp. C9 TaxID=142585 RepID=UPI000BE93C64|nr:ribosome small subunit-dependent GTPase A [Bradyrhizobium sp. C9]PDT72458.1 ribosome small subunit-dependent GTPase A [Bradyrhizobium sp. C9]